MNLNDSQLPSRQEWVEFSGVLHKDKTRAIVLEEAVARPELGVSVPAMTARLSQDVTIAVAHLDL